MNFIKKIWGNRLLYFYYISNRILLNLKNVAFETYPKIYGKLIIIGSGQLILGSKVEINSGLRANPIGGDTKAIIVVGPGARVIIGDNSGLSNCALISKVSIVIGSNVNIGGGVKIYDTDFHNIDSEKRLKFVDDIPKNSPVVIEDNCFIGAHSIILKGVIIGHNSIIGAGSVVSKSVPENEIWAGNPAKFIRKI